MVVIWGSGLYGKVDEIPGFGHVATKFGHLYYIPLIPLGTHFVLEKTGDGWRGAALPFSFKSFLVAWARAGLLISTIVLGIVAAIELTDNRADGGIVVGIMTAVSAALLVASMRLKFIRQASFQRAKEIAEEVGFGEEARILMCMSYGVMSEADGTARLEQIAAAAAAAEEQRRPQRKKPSTSDEVLDSDAFLEE